jgi:rubrerythrin
LTTPVGADCTATGSSEIHHSALLAASVEHSAGAKVRSIVLPRLTPADGSAKIARSPGLSPVSFDHVFQVTQFRGETMAALKGTKTHQNLKDAFAGESQANRRYIYFAKTADIEGYPDVGGLFRDTAEAETGHALGHLDFMKSVGDPASDKPIGSTDINLAAAVAGETFEYTEMYPGMAKSARDENLDEIAEWFETLAKAEKSHAGRFQGALDTLEKL